MNRGAFWRGRWRAPLLAGALWLFFIPCADGERIFRWENAEGQLCFSNVAPPQTLSDYHVLVIPDAPESRIPPQAPTDIAAAGKNLESESTIGPGDRSRASLYRFLTQRIETRKLEISAMERLLVYRNTDERLRRNLMLKRRCLAEELRWLAELTL